MKKFFWPLIVSISLSIGILIGGYIVSSSLRSDSTAYSLNSSKLKINKLLDIIDNEYVDDVNTDSIVDKTVATILEQLDPHSTYIAKSDLQLISESMKGNFVGIGITYNIFQDTVAVVKIIPNGPSDKSGLLAGDRILSADGQILFNKKLSNDSLMAILKGEENSKVKLEIYRKKDKKLLNVQLTREVVPIKSVDIALKLDNGFGYVKINRFSETTHKEFVRELKKIADDNISGLIIDLRGNGGGYMEQAIEIVDEFLEANQVIVKTINKRGNENVSMSTPKGSYKEGELYILIDENSASASEILAGAIQDNDRGIIVGRRSFGKGLVQRELLLGDGSAVRLTISRYYTPSGRSIQKPYNQGVKEYNKEFYNRYEKGELYATDSIKIADTLQFKTKKGRIVYGGGGIVPDLFVPANYKHGDDAVVVLMKSALVNNFVFEQIDLNRNKFESYSLDQLNDKVLEGGKIYNNFRKYLKEKGLEFDLDKRKKIIEFFLVSEFIHQLYDEDAYYQWILKEDPLIKVVENNKETI